MRKKILAIIASMMAASCALTACGGTGGGTSGSGTGGTSGDKIYSGQELFISMRLSGYGKWLDDYVEMFEDETGCKVTVNWNDNLEAEARNIFLSDSYILDDLYFAGVTDQWQKWAKEGKLLEITGFDDLLRDEVKGLGMYNEKRYTLNILMPAMGLVYNQEYLNVIPSSGEYTQGVFPETFQGLLDLCDKINEMGTINGTAVKPMSWGGRVEDLFDMYKMLWAQGNGGEDYTNFVNQQGEAPNEEYFKSDSIKNALEGMVKVINSKDGYSQNSIKGCNELTNIQQEQQFLNGKSVFCPTGAWFETEMKDSITSDTFEYGFANMPLYDTTETVRTTLINAPTEQFFISKNAENAELALEFLKFVFTSERGADIHKSLGTPLSIKYEFTEEDKEELSPFAQDATDLVFNNKIVMRGSSNPMFLHSVTNGQFKDKDGNQIMLFNRIVDGSVTLSNIDTFMNDNFTGYGLYWSDARKECGLE